MLKNTEYSKLPTPPCPSTSMAPLNGVWHFMFAWFMPCALMAVILIRLCPLANKRVQKNTNNLRSMEMILTVAEFEVHDSALRAYWNVRNNYV